MADKIVVAYASVPKDGGTFTFYRNLREPLAQYGIDLLCVSVGFDQAWLWNEAYADEGCVLLAPKTASVKRQAQRFVGWCEERGVDFVFGINSPAILSAIPHLPAQTVALARCANAFDHGYRITLAGQDRLARIVAVIPRTAADLVDDYGAPAERIVLVPNGIDPMPFSAAATQPRGVAPVLRLAFVGRLEHNQKGVLHLPAILRALDASGVDFTFRIAGQGRHEGELRRHLASDIKTGRVVFEGLLLPDEIPSFLGSCDVFLFTSHFEGFGFALLESMMAGTVPVAWHLPGTTDFLVEDGKTGFLAPVGDADRFASHIAALARDRERLAAMSRAARAAALKRFTHERAAESYAGIFREALVYKGTVAPKPWSAFEVNENFRLTLTSKTRAFVKRRLNAFGLWRSI